MLLSLSVSHISYLYRNFTNSEMIKSLMITWVEYVARVWKKRNAYITLYLDEKLT
jgi:hypothetical protein